MQSVVGYFDIGIIVIFLIMLFIGWHFGFFNKLLKIANWFCGLIFSFIFCTKFADFLALFMKKPIYNYFYNKASSNTVFDSITTEEEAQAAVSGVLNDCGLPKFLAKFFSKKITIDDMSSFKEQICSGIGNSISRAILIIISFIVLFIGTTIIFFILKKLVDAFRENKKFRVLDGILGVLFYAVLSFCLVTILMAICYALGSNTSSIYTFFNKDMRLESSSGVGIARYFYNKNLVVNLIKLIF